MSFETNRATAHAGQVLSEFLRLFRRCGLRWCACFVLLAVAPRAWAQGESAPVQPPPTQSPETLFREADAAYEGGDFEQAVRLYEKLLKLQPDSIGARANLGAALAHAGRYDDAVFQYKEALKRDPENSGVLPRSYARWRNSALARWRMSAITRDTST